MMRMVCLSVGRRPHVRNLESMRKTLLLIQNIVNQSDCPDEVREGVEMVRDDLDEVFQAIAEGERI